MSDPVSITSHVTSADREQRHGHPGRIVWLTGLSGAGKSTLAMALEQRLLMPAGMSTYSMVILCGRLVFDLASRRMNGLKTSAALAKLPVSWQMPGYW